MSLGSTTPASRTVEQQATELAQFLAERTHTISAEQALAACAGLPDDPKKAAKQLRMQLEAFQIAIQHTHALRAITKMRGGRVPAHVARALRWDVADWFEDSPAVSSWRRLHGRMGDAADDVCSRVKRRFDPGDEPLLQLHVAPTHIELVSIGEPTPFYHLLLVAIGPDGQPSTFPSVEVVRMEERLRRLVGGAIGGWLDTKINYQWESGLAAAWSGRYSDEPLPEQPTDEVLLDGVITQDRWNALRKHYDAFRARVPEPIDDWLLSRRDSQVARFQDAEFNVGVVEEARLRLNFSNAQIAAALGVEEDDWRGYVNKGQVPSHLFAAVASTLELESPNLLVDAVRSSPRIPIAGADELAHWLSRNEGEVVRYPDSPGAPEIEQQLEALLAVPEKRREKWKTKAPTEIEELCRRAERAGLVICAAAEKRYVQDLPLGRWRMGMIYAFSLATEEDVRTQGEALDDALPEDQVPISAEWLQRFNAQVFTGEDLASLSKAIESRRDPDPEGDNSDLALFTAARHSGKEPHRAHAAITRMEALSRIMKARSLEPWVTSSADGDDSVMVSKAAIEAAARCELIDLRGEAGFDYRKFMALCAEYGALEAVAPN